MFRSHVISFAIALAFVIPTVVFATGSPLNADDSKYRVFCADGKVEVEQRTLEQQKNARGSNVCMLGEYDYLSDAEKRAEGLGGKGAACNCN